MNKRTEEMTPREFFEERVVKRTFYTTGFELVQDTLGNSFCTELANETDAAKKLETLRNRIIGTQRAVSREIADLEETLQEKTVKLGFLKTAEAMLPKGENTNEQ